jgi:predicted acylesterase/phospholipase RssA
VDDAIEKYVELSEAIFTSTTTDPTAKFDHTVLEERIKSVVTTSPLGLNEDAPLRHYSNCRTCVLSTSLRASGSATRLRSYRTRVADPFHGTIWQAARATSAAPTFFTPITIGRIVYGDGGLGWNNPSEEAIDEAHDIWPDRPIGCLVSIGTGLEDAIQLLNQSDPRNFARNLFKGISPGHAFELDVAEYCVKALTSCEKVHRKIDRHPAKVLHGGKYFRLNVPQSMSKIDLQEWKKIDDIIALTSDYMENDGHARRKKQEIAPILLRSSLTG